MKGYSLISIAITVLLLMSGCAEDSVSDHSDVLPPVEFFVAEGATATEFVVKGALKATVDIDGKATLNFDYINGFSRKAVIKIAHNQNIIYGSLKTTLNEGKERGTISVPLYGKTEQMGEEEITVSILPSETTPTTRRVKIMSGDPVELYQPNWSAAKLDGKIFDNVEGSAILKIPYTNGYGRNVKIAVSSEEGIVGEGNFKLNGNYNNGEAGEQGEMEVILSGIPKRHGDVALNVTVSSSGGMKAKGSATINVSENTAVFPDAKFGDTPLVAGRLFKNVLVGLKENVVLKLPYTNGYARKVKVKVDQVDGIGCGEFLTELTAGSVGSNLEIPLEGKPVKAGAVALKITVTPEGGASITIPVSVKVEFPDALVISNVKVVGTFNLDADADENAAIELTYINGYDRLVALSATLSATSGLTLTTPTSVQLAGTGLIKIPIKGKALNDGNFACFIIITSPGEPNVTASANIFVKSDIRDAEFDIDKAIISGDILVKGEAVGATKLVLPYRYGYDRNVSSVKITGVVNGLVSNTTITGSGGTIEIPLSGTPSVSLGDIKITVEVESGKIYRTGTLTIYSGDKVTYEGLTYYTTFFDHDKNGVINAGEIWLDRNIGATSNQTGAWNNQNPASFGHYYHWNSTYGDYCQLDDSGQPITKAITKPAAGTFWTNTICPEGYRLPQRREWNIMLNASVGTTYKEDNNGAFNFDGKTTEALTLHPYRMPMSGIFKHGAAPVLPGKTGAYWADMVLGGGPARLLFMMNGDIGKSDLSGAGGAAYAAHVRCIKK